jgi:hypothetical protein
MKGSPASTTSDLIDVGELIEPTIIIIGNYRKAAMSIPCRGFDILYHTPW